jgi:hypothetical protein
MSLIYCGNNAAYHDLLIGKIILGTRYGCLRKGICRGLYMPYDPKYLGEYIPIDKTKIYCGNKTRLPDEYDRFGSLTNCLQKGIGIGKLEKVKKGSPKSKTKCRQDQIFNSKTGRCVLKKGKIGKEILARKRNEK